MFFNKPARTIGFEAEKLAKNHLLAEGLEFIEANYHCRGGEIDLIFKDKNVLLFLEVKLRSNNRFGSAAEMVTLSKQKKIIKAAEHYLLKKHLSDNVQCRFDVIAIDTKNERQATKIHWIKNAFDAA